MSIQTRMGEYPDSFAKFLRPTDICNFDYGPVRKVANNVTQEATTDFQAIKAAHEFVAALPLGFMEDTAMAHHILKKQKAFSNTKTSLFVTLIRCAGVPARVHAYYIDKKQLSETNRVGLPGRFLFLYPEVYYKGKWQLLCQALNNRSKPDWDQSPFDDVFGRKKPLKNEWVIENLGSFWHPDTVFERYEPNIKGWRKLLLT